MKKYMSFIMVLALLLGSAPASLAEETAEPEPIEAAVIEETAESEPSGETVIEETAEPEPTEETTSEETVGSATEEDEIAILDEMPETADTGDDDMGLDHPEGGDPQEDGDGLNFNASTGTITGHADDCSGALDIPDTIDGVAVIKIGSSAFADCTSLTSVTIPEGVTEIGGSAFKGCTALTRVSLPSSVTKIGSSAFEGCTSLTSISLPAGLTEIAEGLFSDCSALGSIGIPESVTRIGAYAFNGCAKLSSIDLPEGLTSVGKFAFFKCGKLTNVSVPQGVSTITDSVFSDCTALAKITLPDGLTKIEWNAFNGCSSLTSITVPDGVKEILQGTFRDCTSLSSISLPEGLTQICTRAFIGCSALTRLDIPSTLQSLSSYSFSSGTALHCTLGTTGAKTLGKRGYGFWDGGNEYRYVFENGKESGLILLSCDKDAQSITVPSEVTDIDGAAFDGCTKLCEISISGNDTRFESLPEGATILCAYGSDVAEHCLEIGRAIGYFDYAPVTGISLNFARLDLGKGQTVGTLRATVEPENATDRTVIWTSSNESVAMVNAEGEITCVATKGTAVITATAGGYAASCTVTARRKGVTGIALPAEKTVVRGKTATLKATLSGRPTISTVTWTSSDPEVATVSKKGVVTGVSVGAAVITATASSGHQTRCTVTVENQKVTRLRLSSTRLTMYHHGVSRLKVSISPKDAFDKAVLWASSNTDVARIDSNGLIAGITPGTATITCTALDGSGLVAKCTVTVKKVAVKKIGIVNVSDGKTAKSRSYNYEDNAGKTFEVFRSVVTPSNATYPDVRWTSSRESVVSVDEASGRITINGIGTATVSCISVDNRHVKATCRITVTKTAVKGISVTRGGATLNSKTVLNMKKSDSDDTIKVSFEPSNASYQDLVWKTSNKRIAKIENGVLKAVGKGTATITVYAKDNSRAKVSFKVKVS